MERYKRLLLKEYFRTTHLIPQSYRSEKISLKQKRWKITKLLFKDYVESDDIVTYPIYDDVEKIKEIINEHMKNNC